MRNLRLYPSVQVARQSFKGVKTVTVPNQSMSLKEILKRFVRKESLAVEHDGFYADNLGDIEKIRNEDIIVQQERAEELKASILKAQKREEKKKADAEKKKAEQTKSTKDVEESNADTSPKPGAGRPTTSGNGKEG